MTGNQFVWASSRLLLQECGNLASPLPPGFKGVLVALGMGQLHPQGQQVEELARKESDKGCEYVI